MSDVANQELSNLPPSAKLVFTVLERQGPLTQKQIVEESLLSARTTRYALTRLKEIGTVDDSIHFADARQNMYEVV